ncbi:MAG: hypothetical protein KGZ72_10030 [Roseovarius sp.]|jgi:hypothetical protein|nr:hypothetical protein [Roseovarius sp.]
MTIADIIQTIRRDHGGAAWAVFHVVEQGGYRFLPTGQIISAAEYAAVCSAFSPVAADRKRNAVRARAIESHGGGGRRYARN